MKKHLGFLLLVSLSVSSFAQERCGFSVGNTLKQLKNPNFIKQQVEFEYQLREFQSGLKGQNLRVSDKVYRIPVVVHVIHNNASNFIGGANNSNISDEQIKTQIRVLNEDYRRKVGTNGFNANPIGSDMEIEFELATKDPQGNATNGITRTYNAQASFDLQYDGAILANLIRWNYEKYLNIWVVKGKNGTIGYSEFPYDSNLIGLESTPDDIAGQQVFDGVIIDYQNFGTCCGTLRSSYNLGRTTTHEVGHWLGLLHPNGDETCGNDYCDDTPQIERMNDGTTCNKLTSNCGGVIRTNLIEDYMDYSPDRCMNIFTLDQKNRTRAALQNSLRRQRLLQSLEPLEEKEKLTISVEPNPVTNFSKVKVLFKGEKNINISVFDMRGILLNEDTYDGQKSNIYAVKTEKLKTGTYILHVTAGDETSSQRIVINK
jgi:Pregnancy-associated plasma protein-A/Secretion system C-terminal sorting domain